MTALFRGDAPPGQVYVIGLRMSMEEIAKVRARLLGNTQVLEDNPHYLEFCDPYQITWKIMFPGSEFSTAGVFANRWLRLRLLVRAVYHWSFRIFSNFILITPRADDSATPLELPPKCKVKQIYLYDENELPE